MSVESAELRHDTEGLDVERFLDEALDDVIDRLIEGGKVGGLTLKDHLDTLEDRGELSAIIDEALRCNNLQEQIEPKLRAMLWDSDEVHDRAAQLAEEGDDL